MLKKISLKKLSHNELITLSTRVVTAVEAVQAMNSGIVGKVLTIVKEIQQKFLSAVNRSLKNGHAEILKEKDSIRDDAFRAIRDIIMGYSRCLNKNRRQHANQLVKIFERNGWTLYMDGYQDESAELNQLISELDIKENTALINSLGIIDLFNDLKASQKDFEDAFYNKANAATKEDYAIITETRPQLVTSLTDLFERISSDAKFADQPELYNDLVNTLNNIISETATIAKMRITRENGNEDLPVDESQAEKSDS